MARRIVFALMVFCLGASALFAEARTHDSFSASTYYDSNDTVADIIPPKDETTTESKTDDPNMRYPLGHYPGQTHVWNPETEKYEAVNETDADSNGRYPQGHYPGQTHVWNPETEKYEAVNETDTDPTVRYPHGHYPGQTHVWNPETEKHETVNETDTDPNVRYPHGHYPGQTHVWNPETEKYETVNETDTDPNVRYPHGHYPGQTHVWNTATEKYETVHGTGVDPNGNPSEGRYEHGYYGQADTYSEVDTLGVVKSDGYYTDSPSTETTTVDGTHNRYSAGYYHGHSTNPTTYQKYDPETFDPDQGRYRYGYYGTNAPKTTSSKTFMSLASQDSTTQTDPDERYPFGYFGQNALKTTGTGQFKPVTYSSYTGNFETLPYPSSRVPYVPNGDGCRTAYWAENTASWPAFLKITETVGDIFGSKATEVYGQTTVLEALLEYGSDPFKELLRSGCTALLNSYTRGKFPLSPIKVIEGFIAALGDKEAATKQALVFETANVESISAGNACT